VAAALPTGANGRTPPRLGLVSGSREPQPPTGLDVVDLHGGVRTSPLSAHARQWWADQTGHLSVAMELDLIVRDWADRLTAQAGHLTRLPVPTVPALAAWLANRLDWACEHHPGVDTDALHLHRLRATLRAVLGDTEPRPERMYAPCPGCDFLTLVRQAGETKVECGNADCLRVLTGPEYDQWARLTLASISEDDGEELAA
jgi:ribosomal protein S27E